MKYFLDTNTCIFALKGQSSIVNHILTKKPSDIMIPSIVQAELYYGAMKSKIKNKTLESIGLFLNPFEIIAFDESCTKIYAEIRAKLGKNGKIIGPNDLIIAAIVLAQNGTLVTANVKEFKRIRQLSLENWLDKTH